MVQSQHDLVLDDEASAVLRGGRASVLVFVIGSILFGSLELSEHPERATTWVVANTVGIALAVLFVWLATRPATAPQRRQVLTAGYVSVAVLLVTYAVLVDSSWRLLAIGLVIELTTAALFMPLGARGQLVVAGSAVGLYAGELVLTKRLTPLPAMEIITLLGAAGVSVVGASLVERSRREALGAREAARSDARVAGTLIELGRELNATLSRTEVLTRLAQRARSLLNSSTGAINLIDTQNRMWIAEVSGLSEEETAWAKQLYFDMGQMPDAWELLRQPLIELPDIRKQAIVPPELLEQFGYHGALVAPMRRGERILGFIGVAYQTARTPFTDHERQLARGLAEQASLALENARLYAEQQESAEVATALVHAAEVLGSSLEPDKVVHDLAKLTFDLLHPDIAAVYRWQEARWMLAATLDRDPITAARCLPAQFPDSDLPFFRRLRGTWLVELPDPDQRQILTSQALQNTGVEATLTALLARGADTLGLIVAAHRQHRGRFTDRERRVLEGIAQLGVVALTNAQLADQLRRANQVKVEFVASMSHELRTPLNAIVGYTDLLRDGTLGPVGADQADALDRVRERSLDLLQLIQATLDLNRLDSGVLAVDLSTTRAADFVESVRAQVVARWLKPGVDVSFTTDVPDLELHTDLGKLLTITRNLLHNALKFTEHGSVSMRLGQDPSGLQAVIEVRDTGCGIPADKLGEIFDLFVQGGHTPSHDGVGLGLHLSQRYANLLGGWIEVESQLGRGALFRLVLPAVFRPSQLIGPEAVSPLYAPK